ncbi:type I-F CRISPR-associated endoribonuclease Cas6/Csy4 [Pantoea sp. 18069]|uniref:type I-F CRISPR-associated endoribonuclease Cas6/Csy4 n=1 Tax=Pantoea sp. 18069 TaxID=2681415 RepID=UPI00135A9F79|nr:type I-F CRISPR-associated endoribonuclease Cas6/Csy4 [Pantoea sp. 18069]
MATLSHYIDLRLRPDPETTPVHLLAALYTRLHRALAAAQDAPGIAVGFPGYDGSRRSVGDCLRLYGSEAALQPWAAGAWLGNVRDHVSTTGPLPVPAHAAHRALRRTQVKSSPERLRRRLMKRHQLSEEEARQRIPDSVGRMSDLPYIQMASTSTAQQFKLFLALGPAQPQPSPGDFNAYGLSTTATVPWF